MLRQKAILFLILVITVVSLNGCSDSQPAPETYEARMSKLLALNEAKRKTVLPDIPVPSIPTYKKFKKGTDLKTAITLQDKSIRVLHRKLYITRRNIIEFNKLKNK